MSRMADKLKKLGVPKELLDVGQRVIDSQIGEFSQRLPTPEALATRVRGNPARKAYLRELTGERKAGAEEILLVDMKCALETIRKELKL